MAGWLGRHLPTLGHPHRRSARLGVSHRRHRAGGDPLVFPATARARTAGRGVVLCGHPVAGARLRQLRLHAVRFRRRPLSVPRRHRGHGGRHRRGHRWGSSPAKLGAKGGAGRRGRGPRRARAADLAAGEHLSGRRNLLSPHHRAQSAGAGCPPQLRLRPIQAGTARGSPRHSPHRRRKRTRLGLAQLGASARHAPAGIPTRARASRCQPRRDSQCARARRGSRNPPAPSHRTRPAGAEGVPQFKQGPVQAGTV